MGYQQQQQPQGLTVWSRPLSLSALERENGTDTCVEYQLETDMESEKCVAWTRAVLLQYIFEVHVYR